MPRESQYWPDPRSAYTPPTVTYSDSTIAGEGSPEGVVTAWTGAMYVDRANSKLYKKVSGEGTLTGWEEQTAGVGAGSGDVTVGADLDPNGNVTADTGAIFFSAPALGGDGSMWVKTEDGNDQGWE